MGSFFYKTLKIFGYRLKPVPPDPYDYKVLTKKKKKLDSNQESSGDSEDD